MAGHKAHEIVAMLNLIKPLNIEGSIVTIDAIVLSTDYRETNDRQKSQPSNWS